MGKYAIGIDFGTLSARGVLVSLPDGNPVAISEFTYPSGVISGSRFGISTSFDTAFQDPKDYIDALSENIRLLKSKAGINEGEIVGIGIDFTSSTVLPTTPDGVPLCSLPEFSDNAHAYVKLWKHHGAEPEAAIINNLAKERGEAWLDVYGGRISSEWLFPKLLETLNGSLDVFVSTEKFFEAADWLTFLLTGEDVRSACTMGYKAMWNKKSGYPSDEFFSSLDERLSGVIGTKISTDVRPTGSLAGYVTRAASERFGLPEGCAVAIPIIDAHSSILSSGCVKSGTLELILGTSACHILISERDVDVQGICGRVDGGIVEGLVAYEAGQSCFGDAFAWFRKNCIPKSYEDEAISKGIGVFDLLNERAENAKNTVLALDWFNGNRTPYDDPSLSGMLVGLTLDTTPEDIYVGLLTSSAFGTRRIVELYEKSGLEIKTIVASGGISKKNPRLMQILADTLGKEIKVSASEQAAAMGAATLGAAVGYFGSVPEAADALFEGYEKIYLPNPEKAPKYDTLYSEYLALSEHFARNTDVMKRLRNV